jgi:hypothetical protein
MELKASQKRKTKAPSLNMPSPARIIRCRGKACNMGHCVIWASTVFPTYHVCGELLHWETIRILISTSCSGCVPLLITSARKTSTFMFWYMLLIRLAELQQVLYSLGFHLWYALMFQKIDNFFII